MARKRKVEKKPDDFTSQFMTTDSLKNKRALNSFNRMKDNEEAKKNEFEKDPVFSTGAELDHILLEYVRPSPDNSRYMPVKSPLELTQEQIDALTDCVVCEKGVLENRLSESEPRYLDVEKEVEEIRVLAASLKRNDLIHPITVWRANTSNYPIVTGHRRYWALKYLYGTNVKVRCKIYPVAPKNPRVLRHIENFLRSQLAPIDSIDSFKKAHDEISATLTDMSKTERNKVIQEVLGCSHGKRVNYERLISYFEQVAALFNLKLFTSIEGAAEAVSSIEKIHGKNDKQAISEHLQECIDKQELVGIETKKEVQDTVVKSNEATMPKPSHRPKKYLKLPKIKISEAGAVKRLLQEDVTKIDIGIDWNEVDLEDPEQLENVLTKLLETLTK